MGNRRSNPFTTLLLPVLLVGLAAGGCDRDRSASDEVAGRRLAVTPAVKSLAAETRAAMQSIYYFAYNPETPDPEGRLKPQPLPAAVALLTHDQSPGSEQRRGLAIAKLVGASTLVKMPDGFKIQIGPAHVRTALQDLGAPLDRIAAVLAELPPEAKRLQKENAVYAVLGGVDPPPSSPPPGPPPPPPPPPTLVQKSCAEPDDCPEPTVECPTPTTTTCDPQSKVTHATFRVTVFRGMAELRPVMDPQNWARCNSLFFDRTYLAKKDKLLGTFPRNPEGDAEKEPTPFPPGSVWTGVLFEHFTLETLAGTVSFKNLLNISAWELPTPGAVGTATPTPTPRAWGFDYSLKEPINSKVGNETPAPGGIDIDAGSVKLEVDNKQIVVVGEKYIRFSVRNPDPALNGWAKAIMGGMCDVAAGRVGSGGACCDLGGN